MAVRRRLLRGTPNTTITNSYGATGYALVKQGASGQGKIISGVLSGLFVFVSSISGCSSLSVVVTDDEEGDRPIVPETSAVIQTGMTTATKGGIVIQIDIQVYDSQEPIWVWIKTNAGSVYVDDIVMTYGT
tara:strand:- start:10283 stop:10675 length:393 start_codon:yes stop_codon:yes gene_type:complete